jgi:hypothetical protein
MKGNYTAVVKKTGEWWIGWIEEAPGVNCQEATREQRVEVFGLRCGRPWSLIRAMHSLPKAKGLMRNRSRCEAR